MGPQPFLILFRSTRLAVDSGLSWLMVRLDLSLILGPAQTTPAYLPACFCADDTWDHTGTRPTPRSHPSVHPSPPPAWSRGLTLNHAFTESPYPHTYNVRTIFFSLDRHPPCFVVVILILILIASLTPSLTDLGYAGCESSRWPSHPTTPVALLPSVHSLLPPSFQAMIRLRLRHFSTRLSTLCASPFRAYRDDGVQACRIIGPCKGDVFSHSCSFPLAGF